MPVVETFLGAVLRSGLLDRGQVDATLYALPAERRSHLRDVADHFVRAGKLSRFQADKLLKGTSRGLVLGPYQVLAPIGKGGMSTVYLARDQRSSQLVALKVLPPKKARREVRMLARFRREMAMCQRVHHPHLTQTLELGLCQGAYYIAMEFIAGKNLSQLVVGEGPLQVPRAARLFTEVAAGVHHAHEQGLVHRDIKPSNIMITLEDHVKILDLGLAIIEGEPVGDRREIIGGKGYTVGTMDYLAPEQAVNAAAVDARADLYSLGCTLYHALTGRPPFPGGSIHEKIRRHRTDEAVSLQQLNPHVPASFASLISRMMAKKAEDRPVSAKIVSAELRRWAGS